MDKYIQNTKLRLLEISTDLDDLEASDNIIIEQKLQVNLNREIQEIACLNSTLNLTDFKEYFVIDICPVVFESFLGYIDYYLVTSKVIITLASRAKLIDVRVVLNTSTKVSIITLDTIV